MYAHLFDHDIIYINRLETIIDRFCEICDIKPPQNEQVRDRLINIISLDLLVKLVKKLPQEQQGILKVLQDSPSSEQIDNFKKKFSNEDLTKEFHTSALEIIQGKIEGIKAKIAPDKLQQLEDLVKMIGKF